MGVLAALLPVNNAELGVALGLAYFKLLLLPLLLLPLAAASSSGTVAAMAMKVMLARPAADTSVANFATSLLTKPPQLAVLPAMLGTVASAPAMLLLLLLALAPPSLDLAASSSALLPECCAASARTTGSASPAASSAAAKRWIAAADRVCVPAADALGLNALGVAGEDPLPDPAADI
jgi:hypothetical protein